MLSHFSNHLCFNITLLNPADAHLLFFLLYKKENNFYDPTSEHIFFGCSDNLMESTKVTQR